MAIRYDSQLKAEVRRTVKSFNAKIRRLEAKGVSAGLLPEKVSSKEIQEGIQNRRDLRKRLQQLDEFTSAGIVEESQGGLLGTDMLFQYRQGEANKAIRELNKEYEKSLNLNPRYPMMQGEYMNNLKTKMDYLSKDVRSLDIRQINIFNKNLLTPEQRAIKNEQFYSNFRRMLYYNAYRLDIPPMDLEKLSPAELLKLYQTEPSFKMIVEGYLRLKGEAGESDDEEMKEAYEAAKNALVEFKSKQ